MNLLDSSPTVVCRIQVSSHFQEMKASFILHPLEKLYYIQIVGDPNMDGYAYQFRWVDQDNTADPNDHRRF